MVQGLGNNFIGANSIQDFNRVFDEHLKNIDKSFEQISTNDFEKILEVKTQEATMQSFRPVNTGMEINVGNVNIPNFYQEVQQVKSSSQVENAMNDLGRGFLDGLNSINAKQLEAEHAVETLAAGGDISVHEVMIAAEKANLSMQMGLQVRNKILAAYNSLYNISM